MPIVATNPYDGTSVRDTVVPLDLVAITPSDTDELAEVVRGLECITPGTVVFKFLGRKHDGVQHTWTATAAGQRYTGYIRQVMATGTTGTWKGIV